MSEEPVTTSPLQRHRFFVLIIAVVMIALFLVSVSLSLYNSSGTAQVDLSRPGYEAVRGQAGVDAVKTSSFSATGELDKEAFAEFNTLYRARAAKVEGVDSFDEAALSEDSLQLLNSTPSVE